MKKLLLSLLCLLAVFPAAWGKTIELTTGSFTSGNGYTVKTATNVKNTDNPSINTGFDFVARYAVSSSKFQYNDRSSNAVTPLYLGVSGNTNNYNIKSVTFKVESGSKKFLLYTSDTAFEAPKDSEGKINTSSKESIDVSKATVGEVYTVGTTDVTIPINAKYFLLDLQTVSTGNTVSLVSKFTITYEEAASGPVDANFAVTDVEDGVMTLELEDEEVTKVFEFTPADVKGSLLYTLTKDEDNEGDAEMQGGDTFYAMGTGKYTLKIYRNADDKYNEINYTFTINVINPLKEMNLNLDPIDWKLGENTLNYTVTDADGNELKDYKLTWEVLSGKAENIEIKDGAINVKAYGAYKLQATVELDGYKVITKEIEFALADPSIEYTDTIDAKIANTTKYNTNTPASYTSSTSGIEYKIFYNPTSANDFTLKSSVTDNNTYKKQHSGIIVTKNPNGYVVKEIKVYWQDESGNVSRKLDVYYTKDGSAFEHENNLWGKQADNNTDWEIETAKLIRDGVSYDASNLTMTVIPDVKNKQYIGLRAAEGSIKFTKIEISWGAPLPEKSANFAYSGEGYHEMVSLAHAAEAGSKIEVKHDVLFGGSDGTVEEHYELVNVEVTPADNFADYITEESTLDPADVDEDGNPTWNFANKGASATFEAADGEGELSHVFVKAHTAGVYNVTLEQTEDIDCGSTILKAGKSAPISVLVRPSVLGIGLAFNWYPVLYQNDEYVAYYEKDYNEADGENPNITWTTNKAIVSAYEAVNDKNLEIYWKYTKADNSDADEDDVTPLAFVGARAASDLENVTSEAVPDGYTKFEGTTSAPDMEKAANGDGLTVIVRQNGILSAPTQLAVASSDQNNDPTAVEAIEAVKDGEAVYYTLDGVRVANPEKGLFIVVKGGKAQKVYKTF